MAFAPQVWRQLLPWATWKNRSPEAIKNFLTFLERSRWLMSSVTFIPSGNERNGSQIDVGQECWPAAQCGQQPQYQSGFTFGP